ncbi:hypothetical protein BC833DRAFT_626745 [Globomyces pollinis-pini]|nr:hypothetical protein BC833DRAFT_626745 [Globomyces pollinis-pini]
MKVTELQHRTRDKQHFQNSDSTGKDSINHETLPLILRMESAETRSKALEMELIESAKAFGKQIYELKLKLKNK